MQVPFLDLKSQYKNIKEEINPAIQQVLDDTAYVLGKAVNEFEEKFAALHEVKYCIGTSSGTDANHLILWANGIGPGDEVIMPANTFIATAWGATLCGAKPVFVDCLEDTYNIDPEKVEKAINEKTKAIVCVHLYGQPAEMDSLKKISHKYSIPLIEDAAQAHIADYSGKKVGGIGYAASFSFYPGKNLGAYGEAGAVTTDDEDFATKIRMMRDHGMHVKYDHECFGHNYRMEGIQGAVLGVKLNHIESWTESRIRNAALYGELLRDVDQLILPKKHDKVCHVYHLYVMRLRSSELGKRENLMKYLADNGIGTGLHYPKPLHRQTCFNYLNYDKNEFPITNDLAENGLSLPMYPELTEDHIEYISRHIKQFFKQS